MSLKPTTLQHLRAAKRHRGSSKSDFVKAIASTSGGKDARSMIRKDKKARKSMAAELRGKRKEHGSYLTRLWHRAGA